MRREIDILVEAARKDCAVVEKASHMLWTCEDLLDARASGRYQGQDRLLPPDSRTGVTSPFPGCCQQGMAGLWSYHAVGQTEHFVIFTRAGAECSRQGEQP